MELYSEKVYTKRWKPNVVFKQLAMFFPLYLINSLIFVLGTEKYQFCPKVLYATNPVSEDLPSLQIQKRVHCINVGPKFYRKVHLQEQHCWPLHRQTPWMPAFLIKLHKPQFQKENRRDFLLSHPNVLSFVHSEIQWSNFPELLSIQLSAESSQSQNTISLHIDIIL